MRVYVKRKIKTRQVNIDITWLGYVGLPLAVEFAREFLKTKIFVVYRITAE